MSEKKIKIPGGMLKAAHDAAMSNGGQIEKCLESSFQWFIEQLHESNVNFHRAILDKERIRYKGPDHDSMIISHRVAFEYGASFAVNYIRDMFYPTQEPPEGIKDLLLPIRNMDEAHSDTSLTCLDYNQAIVEAYRRGMESK